MIGENIGKYRVLDRVGRGGMGTVYRAMDETLHREVAIKVLNAELNEPEVAKRFRAEAITVARLSHPGIATVFELFEHDGRWLMAMEFVRGETFEQIVSRAGALDPQLAGILCMQSLAALAHAHSMGVVHRDLKPANIMRTASGDVKVMDFGIARVTGSEHLTTVGFMMGTPAYMAPEQVQGGEIDARADLYAMGVVFFRLLTAQLPFRGDTPFAMAQAQVSAEPLPVEAFRKDLPGWVGDVLTKALQKRPEDRFQSAMEFHGALQEVLAGAAMPTPTSSLAPTGLMPTARPVPIETMAETLATPVATPSVRVAGAGPEAPVAETVTTPAMPAAAPSPAVAVARPPDAASKSAQAPAPSKRKAGPAPVVWAAAAVVLLAVAGGGWWALSPRELPVVEAPPVASNAGADVVLPVDVSTLPEPAASAGPVAGNRSAAPAASAATPASETPEAAPTSASAPSADTAAVSIEDIKVLVVDGRRTDDRDATLNMGDGRIVAEADEGDTVLASWSYGAVKAATYAHARSPRWDPSFSSPPDDLDVGGFFRASRHYLTLQNEDDYLILRLEDVNVIQVIRELEARTGLSIPRTDD